MGLRFEVDPMSSFIVLSLVYFEVQFISRKSSRLLEYYTTLFLEQITTVFIICLEKAKTIENMSEENLTIPIKNYDIFFFGTSFLIF